MINLINFKLFEWCRVGIAGALLLSMGLLLSCSQKQNEHIDTRGGRVVVALEGDVDSFNPLFSEDVAAGEINDLFYPSLMSSRFDTGIGVLQYEPMLAESWELEKENRDIRFHLRSDVKWSDGIAVTAHDVQVSYELYADSAVASVRQSSVDGLRRGLHGSLDIKQAIEVVDDSTVIFHYDHPYPGQLFDAGLPIVPAHLYAGVDQKELHEAEISRHPVSSRPFALQTWKPLEEIVLVSNQASMLPHPARLSGIVFRVIPDYRSRLMQLRSGEIDILPYINVEDALELKKNSSTVRIIALGERFYDAINWNNIDPQRYAESGGSVIQPNPLFGRAKVRQALTLAINRKEIVESFLRPYGREAVGPISPLFRWAFNDTLVPMPYDPKRAADLLADEGWQDHDGDGILDRGGKRFSFTLVFPAGNPLRSSIATIVQRQLANLKIEVKLEQIERSVFWENVMQKKFDACIAGFSVPLQMQLDEWWGSNLNRSRFNLASFQNHRIDEILSAARRGVHDTLHAAEWKEFQVILRNEQPCTFLYWMNDLVAVNQRVQGTEMGVLGVAFHAGEWFIENNATTSAKMP